MCDCFIISLKGDLKAAALGSRDQRPDTISQRLGFILSWWRDMEEPMAAHRAFPHITIAPIV